MAKNPMMIGMNAIINKHMDAMRAELMASLPALMAQAFGFGEATKDLRQETVELAAPKRKRGRPKKAEAEKVAAAPKKKSMRRHVTPVKKVADGNAKRGPGRPKGSKNKMKVDPAEAKPVATATSPADDYDALRASVASIPTA